GHGGPRCLQSFPTRRSSDLRSRDRIEAETCKSIDDAAHRVLRAEHPGELPAALARDTDLDGAGLLVRYHGVHEEAAVTRDDECGRNRIAVTVQRARCSDQIERHVASFVESAR